MSEEKLLDDRDVIHVYRGGGVHARVVPAEGDGYPLRHVVRHSPTGFEYGYGGSGPADLALSMLTAVLGKEQANRLYQAFKRDRIAAESGEHWSMKAETIREWAEHEEAAARARR